MKWSDFESKYPTEYYSQTRTLCEEIHANLTEKGGFAGHFCHECHQREGWYCFPCQSLREIYQTKIGNDLEKLLNQRS